MSSNMVKTDKEDVSEVKFKQFNYKWRIKNFKHLYKQPGSYVDSPVFSFGSKKDINWRLRLYPNGDCKENENYLSLYLHWEHNSILEGQFRLSLIDKDEKKEAEDKVALENKLVEDLGRGYDRFISRSKVLNEESGLLPNGCLIINCEIILSLGLDQTSEDEKEIPKVKLRPNLLEKLFLDKQLSDISLIGTLDGKSLPANKSVLATFSPVLEEMFKEDVLNQDEMKIEDGKYEVIKEMLRFLYLGEIENAKDTVFDLVKLAYKYKISELIEFCEKELISQISVDNVFKLITLAVSCNMEDLKKSAIDYGILHLKDVVKTDDVKSSNNKQALMIVLEAFGQQ